MNYTILLSLSACNFVLTSTCRSASACSVGKINRHELVMTTYIYTLACAGQRFQLVVLFRVRLATSYRLMATGFSLQCCLELCKQALDLLKNCPIQHRSLCQEIGKAFQLGNGSPLSNWSQSGNPPLFVKLLFITKLCLSVIIARRTATLTED